MDVEAELALIYLPDSWVLEVRKSPTAVAFTLDAVLMEGHPRFYWPPRPGEQHPYARLRWLIEGDVTWTRGSLGPPARDANGELDLGNVDTWVQSDGVDHLEGSWGEVAIENARHSIQYL